MRLLILSAIEKEQDLLPKIKGVEVAVCGIGNLNAALFLESRSEIFPEEIIFIGSAGSYESTSNSLGMSNTFVRRDLSVLEGNARIPPPIDLEIETKTGPVGRAIELELKPFTGVCNCPESISLKKTTNSNAKFENMECYGLALVCMRRKIPFSALFSITNEVGPDGSADWLKNFERMSRELQQSILPVIEKFMHAPS